MSDRCAAGTRKPGTPDREAVDREELNRRLAEIRHKVLVLSGKGGVGKSTVAVNLAASLAAGGFETGLLDVDVHGPSVPGLLGLDAKASAAPGGNIAPVLADERLKVMSIGLLLPTGDDAVIWRGPLKMGVIKQFLKDVEWGRLDYLVIDSPPGTGDEPLSVAQLVPDADGAVIVTTPQDVAVADVRRCISFCRQVELPVIGVIENMSGFACPKCGEVVDIFKRDGGRRMAVDMGVPFLGRVPLAAGVVESGDDGRPCVLRGDGDPAAEAFAAIADSIRDSLAEGETASNAS
jgi:Mrp family chromosome partitioning ATPase